MRDKGRVSWTGMVALEMERSLEEKSKRLGDRTLG